MKFRTLRPMRGALPNNSVGVVMPVSRETPFFRLAFYSVLSFTDYPWAFTVVANCPDSHLRRFLRPAASNNGVGVIDYSEVNRAASINLAMRHMFTSGGISFGCVLPPDVIAEPGWLSSIMAEFTDQPDLAVVAPKTNVVSACPCHDLYVFRRRSYLAVGGFDEQLHGGYEDLDFCAKVRARNERVALDQKTYIHRFAAADPFPFAAPADIAMSRQLYETRYPHLRESDAAPVAATAGK